MIIRSFDEVVLFARTGLNPRKNFKLGQGTNKYITIKNIRNNSIVGVKENEDGALSPVGIEQLKDKATLNNEVAKYIPSGIDYEIFDFSYDSSEYQAVQNKKYQLLIVHDTPERLPFISLNATNDLEK